jgi:hypothetical protein
MYRKKITSIIIGILLAAVLSAWYIDKFVAPTGLKKFFIKNISLAIDRPISLKDAHFNVIRGFTLEGLTVYEPDGKTAFMEIDRLSTSLLFIPLLLEKQIIIPAIYVTAPSLNIVKNQDDSWNFLNPPLFKKEAAVGQPKKKGFSVLVQRIKVNNGEINFCDNTKDPVYTKQLIALDGDVSFSIKNGLINFKMLSQLKSELKTRIGLEGSYSLKENTFIIKASAKNLSILEPYNYFSKTDFLLTLKEGLADVFLDMAIDKEKKSRVILNSSIKNMDASALGVSLKGALDINGAFDLTPSEPPQLKYKIDLGLRGPALSGVYLLNEITSLSGKIEITNDAIRAIDLEGYAYNTPVKFSGDIDLKTTEFKLAGDAVMDLANYKNFLPRGAQDKFKGIELSGPADISFKLHDKLKDPQPADIDGNVRFKAATLKTTVLPHTVENISGELLFKNDAMYVSRTSFGYGAQNYIIDAKISNLALPDVKMKLKSEILSLDSRFQALKDGVHIMRLAGKYLNSYLNISGDIQKLENPYIVMRGNIVLDLVDLRKLLPPAADSLTRFDIRGLCNLDMSANGTLKEPDALDVAIKGQSDRIGFWDLKIADTRFNLMMKGRRIYVSELSARPYGGTLLANLDIDLAQQNPPYAINVAMEEIDLSKLALDTDLKNKPVSGKALFKCGIRGYGKNPETVKGEGAVFIKGGYLWEMPFLKGIADLLFMPNLSSIVFDEASANFAIANKAISTSNLRCHSRNVGLLADGALYFDGGLDFTVTTSISENFVKQSTEFERLASSLLAEAGQLMGRIKIGGTIKKPEYKFIPFPIDKILTDKVKGLLGGFF